MTKEAAQLQADIRRVTAEVSEIADALERILAMLGGPPPPGKPTRPAIERPRLELVCEEQKAA